LSLHKGLVDFFPNFGTRANAFQYQGLLFALQKPKEERWQQAEADTAHYLLQKNIPSVPVITEPANCSHKDLWVTTVSNIS